MALLTLTPPAVEPVLLDDLKDFLRVDANDDSNDAVLTALGIAARQWVEAYTQRRLITQKLRLLIDFFPGYIDLKLVGQKVSTPFASGANAVLVGLRYAIALPLPPVQQINVFQYLDANGNPVAMNANTDYIADLSSQPARLTPPFGDVWPVARVVPNAVSVDYTVGYGADGSSVPEGIKLAIKMLAASWYENRLPDQQDVPKAVKAMLFGYRDLRF